MSPRHRMWAAFNLATVLLGTGMSGPTVAPLALSVLFYTYGFVVLGRSAHHRAPTRLPTRMAVLIFWWISAIQVGAFAALHDWGASIGAAATAGGCLWFFLRLREKPPADNTPLVWPVGRRQWVKLVLEWALVSAVYLAALLLVVYVAIGVFALHGSSLQAMVAVGLIALFHIPVGYLVRSPLAVALPWLPVVAGVVTSSDLTEEAYWLAALIGITPFGLIGVAVGRRLDRRRTRVGGCRMGRPGFEPGTDGL